MSKPAGAALRAAICALVASAPIAVSLAAAVAQTYPAGSTERTVCATTFEAEVEVNIYSGMRNPHFTLRGADARTLWTLLNRPMAPAFAYRSPPDLGFRGYDVMFACPAKMSATVWGEVIVMGGMGGLGASPLRDPQRAIHRLLSAHYPVERRDVIPRAAPRAR